ncbi:MAG: hypothetical protein PHV30_11020, partial [Candidatus Margulisbacteria bacterium]|nr:hypothetical protein [Candidatus Margulisiibacteriota bacterium]
MGQFEITNFGITISGANRKIDVDKNIAEVKTQLKNVLKEMGMSDSQAASLISKIDFKKIDLNENAKIDYEDLSKLGATLNDLLEIRDVTYLQAEGKMRLFLKNGISMDISVDENSGDIKEKKLLGLLLEMNSNGNSIKKLAELIHSSDFKFNKEFLKGVAGLLKNEATLKIVDNKVVIIFKDDLKIQIEKKTSVAGVEQRSPVADTQKLADDMNKAIFNLSRLEGKRFIDEFENIRTQIKELDKTKYASVISYFYWGVSNMLIENGNKDQDTANHVFKAIGQDAELKDGQAPRYRDAKNVYEYLQKSIDIDKFQKYDFGKIEQTIKALKENFSGTKIKVIDDLYDLYQKYDKEVKYGKNPQKVEEQLKVMEQLLIKLQQTQDKIVELQNSNGINEKQKSIITAMRQHVKALDYQIGQWLTFIPIKQMEELQKYISSEKEVDLLPQDIREEVTQALKLFKEYRKESWAYSLDEFWGILGERNGTPTGTSKVENFSEVAVTKSKQLTIKKLAESQRMGKALETTHQELPTKVKTLEGRNQLSRELLTYIDYYKKLPEELTKLEEVIKNDKSLKEGERAELLKTIKSYKETIPQIETMLKVIGTAICEGHSENVKNLNKQTINEISKLQQLNIMLIKAANSKDWSEFQRISKEINNSKTKVATLREQYGKLEKENKNLKAQFKNNANAMDYLDKSAEMLHNISDSLTYMDQALNEMEQYCNFVLNETGGNTNVPMEQVFQLSNTIFEKMNDFQQKMTAIMGDIIKYITKNDELAEKALFQKWQEIIIEKQRLDKQRIESA